MTEEEFNDAWQERLGNMTEHDKIFMDIKETVMKMQLDLIFFDYRMRCDTNNTPSEVFTAPKDYELFKKAWDEFIATRFLWLGPWFGAVVNKEKLNDTEYK